MNSTDEKDKIFWDSLSVYGNTIFIAGTTGVIIEFSLTEGIKNRYDTELDNLYLQQTSSTVFAIGRWNTEWITIEKKTNKTKKYASLFSGRTTAVATFESQFFIAGADKDENAVTKKDSVKLKEGLLYLISGAFEKELRNLPTRGRIQNLAFSKKWMAYVDDENKNTLVLKNRTNNTEKKIDEKSPITATFSLSENIYYAITGEVIQFDENVIQRISFKEKDISILKIAEAAGKIHVLTSKGVFELSSGKKISVHSGQPATINPYQNGLLILWQDGFLEFYKSGQAVKRYSII